MTLEHPTRVQRTLLTLPSALCARDLRCAQGTIALSGHHEDKDGGWGGMFVSFLNRSRWGIDLCCQLAGTVGIDFNSNRGQRHLS